MACQSTTVSACRHRATSMLLILEWWKYLCQKVACKSTTATDCSHRATYMLLFLVCKSGLSVHNSHSLQPQNYLHANYFVEVSVCKSGLSVHDSHSLHLEPYSKLKKFNKYPKKLLQMKPQVRTSSRGSTLVTMKRVLSM